MKKSMKDLNDSVKETDNPVIGIIEKWPRKPKEYGQRLIDYYGDPDEYSASRLIWHNTGDGWKRTILSTEEIPHNFPAQHHDFLEQVINYKVPVSLFSSLARFDGSIIVERTKGEMSARCAGTSMNFAAINLAHDIISGEKTVEAAREEYTELYRTFQKGEKSPYTESFQFDLPEGDTGDTDVTTL
ncbi:MAG: hypothetical protein WD317_11240 [Balneolaceae bacterium]